MISRNIYNCTTGDGFKEPKGGVDKGGDKLDQVIKQQNIKPMGSAVITRRTKVV